MRLVTEAGILRCPDRVSGDIDPAAFHRRFLEWWREDRDFGIATGQALDDLMTAVDSYDENPDVLMRIGGDQLGAEARQVLSFVTGQ